MGIRGTPVLILSLSAVPVVQVTGLTLGPLCTDAEKTKSLASTGVRKWVSLGKNVSIAVPDQDCEQRMKKYE
jgi:hypothetical protein